MDYQSLVANMANGADIDATDAAVILEQAGRTTDDLRADVAAATDPAVVNAVSIPDAWLVHRNGSTCIRADRIDDVRAMLEPAAE